MSLRRPSGKGLLYDGLSRRPRRPQNRIRRVRRGEALLGGLERRGRAAAAARSLGSRGARRASTTRTWSRPLRVRRLARSAVHHLRARRRRLASACSTTSPPTQQRLPLDLALFIACEVAEALAAARLAGDHRRHRSSVSCISALGERGPPLVARRGEGLRLRDGPAPTARRRRVRCLRGVAGKVNAMAPEVAQGGPPMRGRTSSRSESSSASSSSARVSQRHYQQPRRFSLAREGYVQPFTFQPCLPPGLVSVLTRALEIDPRRDTRTRARSPPSSVARRSRWASATAATSSVARSSANGRRRNEEVTADPRRDRRAGRCSPRAATTADGRSRSAASRSRARSPRARA